MARSLDQISKDLALLEKATASIDEDLKTLYQDYLAVLGQAVKRQLVLAVYHLCTQAYPDEFLELSVGQREKIQVGIRKIAQQGQSQIEQLGQVLDLSGLATKLEEAVAARTADEQEPETGLSTESAEVPSGEQISVDNVAQPDQSDSAMPDSVQETPKEEATIVAASKEATEMIRRLSTSLSLFAVFGAEPLSPVSLAKRHVLLERHLRAILQTLSSLTNHLLKQAHILPDLPEMVIAAAAEAEPGDGGPSTPNLLNVLVEMGSDRRSEEEEEEEEEAFEEGDFDDDEGDREMTHLVAINLRLADIEFADTHTALWRSKLQEALHKLKRLGSRYQKLQQEKARAEAEHAWRATWYEE